MSTTNTTTPKSSFFAGRKMWFWIAVGLGLVTTLLLTLLLQGLTATTTYYVLNKSVPARTVITAEDLEEVVTRVGGQPGNLIDVTGIISGGDDSTYSLYALNVGDVLTNSNAGELSPLTVGIPEDFVVASFSASPNLAAGGNLKRGDYIDISFIGETGGSQVAKLVLQRVMIIDVSADLEGAAAPEEGTSTDPNSVTSAYRGGIPSLYTVGLSQEDSLTLALAQQYPLFLTLSSENSSANGASPATVDAYIEDLFTLEAGDAGEGTDNTFETGNTGDETNSETNTDDSNQ